MKRTGERNDGREGRRGGGEQVEEVREKRGMVWGGKGKRHQGEENHS